MDILIKRGTSTILTVKPQQASTYLRAIMGDETVTLVWEQAMFTALQVGDFITFNGIKHTLNQLPAVKKISTHLFQYNAVFQSPIYDLLKAGYMLFDNTSTPPQADFPLTGTPDTFVTLLVANLNRVFGGDVWSKGTVLTADVQTLTFSNENCYAVIQKLATAFKTEYSASGTTINLIEISSVSNLTLEYGSTLYDIERKTIDSSSVITRLYPFGGTRNIAANYRSGSKRLLLPDPLQYLEANVNLYGVIEGQQTFEDVYPRLGAGSAGTVTSIGGDIFTFSDSNLDFNPNDCLMPGTPAKVRFLTGPCAGYDLEIASFNNSTKTFVAIANTDDKGFSIPNVTLYPAVGNKYVLLDIIMPDEYVIAAEEEQQTKAQEYLDDNSHPKVSYLVTFAEIYAKINSADVFPGNMVTVSDSDIGINTQLRVVKVQKGVIDPWNIKIDLSDTVSQSTLTRFAAEIAVNTEGITEINKGVSQQFGRNWRNVQELSTMIDTLRSDMLFIGNVQGQFNITGTFFTPNYQNDKNKFYATPGYLIHKTIPETAPGTWMISAYAPTLTGDTTPFYLYAKCSRSAGTGVYYLSASALAYDSEPTYYYFLVGVLSSVSSGVRTLQTTYGFTQITGKQVATGMIKSSDGSTYFDLDAGKIGGNIDFVDGLISGLISLLNESNEISGGLNGLKSAVYKLWLGATTPEAANFSVDKDGNLKATNAVLNGIITAISGKIGNLFISGDALLSDSMEFSDSAVETLASLISSPITASISRQASWSGGIGAYTQNITLTVPSVLVFNVETALASTTGCTTFSVNVKTSAGVIVYSGFVGLTDYRDFSVNLPSGIYSISVSLDGSPTNNSTCVISGFADADTIVASGFVSKTKIGNDGFFSFWNANSYFYYSDSHGLEAKKGSFGLKIDATGTYVTGQTALKGDTGGQGIQGIKGDTGDASPKGSYADLAALITANPAHTATYLTLDNGHWNYYNGTTFVDGGEYLSTGDAATKTDLTVKINKIQGVNLLNPAIFRYNDYYYAGQFPTIMTDGDGKYGLSDYIPANPLGLITISTAPTGAGTSSFAVFDDGKNWLRNGQDSDQYVYEEGDGFVVFGFFSGYGNPDLDAAKIAIVVGTTYLFEKFTEYLPLLELQNKVETKLDSIKNSNLLNPSTFRYNDYYYAGQFPTIMIDGDGKYGLSDYIPANPLGLITISTAPTGAGTSSFAVFDDGKNWLRNGQDSDQYVYEEGDGFVVFGFFSGYGNPDLDAAKIAIVVGTTYLFEEFTEYLPILELQNKVETKMDSIKSSNLLNPSTFQYGCFYWAGQFGTLNTDDPTKMQGCSDYIPANPLGLITKNTGRTSSALSSFAVFDKDKTWLRNGQDTDQYTYQFGDRFVRFCYYINGDLEYAEKRAIVVGTVYSFDLYSEYAPLTELGNDILELKSEFPIEKVFNGTKLFYSKIPDFIGFSDVDTGNDWIKIINTGTGTPYLASKTFTPSGSNLVHVKFSVEFIKTLTTSGFEIYLIGGSPTIKYLSIATITANGDYDITFDPAYYAVYETFTDFAIWLFMQDLPESGSSIDIKFTGLQIFEIANPVKATNFSGDNVKELLQSVDTAITEVKNSVDLTLINPNGEKYEFSVDNSGNIVLIPIIPNTAAFFGNSLLVGFGYGMAASENTKDYYYLITEYIKTLNAEFTSTRNACEIFENISDSALTDDNIQDEFIANLVGTENLVCVQLGDNVNSTERRAVFVESSFKLLQQIRIKCPNARVAWMGMWFESTENYTSIQNACAKAGCKFITFSDLISDLTKNSVGNTSKVGTGTHELSGVTNVVENSSTNITVTFTVGSDSYNSTLDISSYSLDAGTLTYSGEYIIISNPGIAAHPNDEGFRLIANRFLYQMKLSDDIEYYK